jgi:hypothetical protein
MHYLETILLALTGMLAIMSLIVGMEKMMKIVLGNYMVMGILLWLHGGIDSISLAIGWWSENMLLNVLYNILTFILSNGKPTLLLTIYFLLLAIVTTKIHIPLWEATTERQKWLITILCIPCTVISILTNIIIATVGITVFDLPAMQTLLETIVPTSQLFTTTIQLIPLYIFLPWGIVILIAWFWLRQPISQSTP